MIDSRKKLNLIDCEIKGEEKIVGMMNKGVRELEGFKSANGKVVEASGKL